MIIYFLINVSEAATLYDNQNKLKEYLQTIASYLINKPKRKLLRLCFKLKGKVGLEVGGPSSFFLPLSYFPVYLFARRIDVVNYSDKTVWEGQITEGNTYHYFKNKTGHQYIAEATDINKIKSSSYDFVLSCHSLEHIANPVKALFEWKRVLKKKGILVVVLPSKNITFDHKRSYTSYEHILSDYQNNVGENDNTHFEEIIKLHDVEKDPGLLSAKELYTRTLENYKNRCVHHHVYSLPLVKQLLEFCGYSVLYQQEVHNFHLVTIAQII
jgi:SAM-dependent methyltransferase